MVKLHSNLSIMFWNIIFETIRRKNEVDNPKLILISPWMSDIEIDNSRWSSGALQALTESIEWNGTFDKLSDVLSAAVKCGIEVQVILAARNGKWLKKSSDIMVQRESVFIEKLKKYGVKCNLKPDFHRKNILSPFAYLSGSANFTANGLTGRLSEEIDWTHRDLDTGAYQNSTESIDLFTSEVQWEIGTITRLSDYPEHEIINIQTGDKIKVVTTDADVSTEFEIDRVSDFHPSRPIDYLPPEDIVNNDTQTQSEDDTDRSIKASYAAQYDGVMRLSEEVGLLPEGHSSEDNTIDHDRLRMIENNLAEKMQNQGSSEAINQMNGTLQNLIGIGTAIQGIEQNNRKEIAAKLSQNEKQITSLNRSRSRLKAKLRI
jgi:hypothetical protein